MQVAEIRNHHTILFQVFLISARGLLGGLFVFSAAVKIVSFSNFIDSVYQYHIVPFELVPWFAFAVVCSELFFGVLFLFNRTARVGGFGLSALLILFIVAIIISMNRGLSGDCGCFGEMFSSKIGWRLLLRDVALFICIVPLSKIKTKG